MMDTIPFQAVSTLSSFSLCRNRVVFSTDEIVMNDDGDDFGTSLCAYDYNLSGGTLICNKLSKGYYDDTVRNAC